MGATLTATIDSDAVSSAITLDWNGTNYTLNPAARIASGTSDVRVNTFNNPCAGTNLNGWSHNTGTAGTGTLSRQTGSGLAAGLPDTYVRQTWDTITSGIPGSTGPTLGSSGADYITATAALPFTISAYARSSHADRTAALVVQFHDAAGTVLSTVQGATVAVGGGWTRLSYSTSSTPATTTRVSARVYGQGGTNWVAGDTFDVTAVLAEQWGVVNAYFDGSTALAQSEIDEGWTRVWSGTAHASTSISRLPLPTAPLTINSTTTVAGGRVYSTTDAEYRMRYYAKADLASSALIAWSSSGAAMPAAVGENWVARFEVRQIGGAQNIGIYARLASYNSGGTSVSLGTLSPVAVLTPDSPWQQVAVPLHQIVSPGVTARLLIYRGNTLTMPAGSVIEVRRIVCEKGTNPVAGEYYDGSMTGYQWTGAADASPSTIIPTTSATIVRVNSDDGTVSPVRNAEPAQLISGQWIGPDYEPPLDADFFYRATSADVPGFELLSPTYSIASLDRSMLKHPGRPALNSAIRIGAAPSITRPVSQGVFEVLGRVTPIAVSMRRSAARGELEVLTFDSAERDALLLLLDDGTPLLLQTPSANGVGNVYISVGEVTEGRVTGVGSEWARRWTLPFVVVDRPTGAALAVGNSWADVLATYASWDAMRKAEGTWAGVLEGLGS